LSLAVIEINDAELRLLTADGKSFISSGYACFDDTPCFGNDAKQKYWLKPSQSDAKFWSLLSTKPWVGSKIPIRHRADIGYAQLKALWANSNATELMLLVPASFNGTQLGLLVGMCQTLPNCKNISAVASNALMYASAVTKTSAVNKFVIADLSLHHIESYQFERTENTLIEAQHKLFSDLGEVQLEETIARNITDAFIHLHRYDPQHTAASDQALRDHIPECIAQLAEQSSYTLSLETTHGETQLSIQKNDVNEVIRKKLQTFVDYLNEHERPVFITQRLAKWMRFCNFQVDFREIENQSAVSQAQLNQAAIIEACQPLHRLSALSVEPLVSEKSEQADNHATHILIEGTVFPIHQLCFSESGGVLGVTKISAQASLRLHSIGSVIRLEKIETGETVDEFEAKAGAHITLGSQRYVLMRLDNA